ncbi:restriction endonuclease subunit S [Pontibacter liquoris]|uniref:restriction endonuclease subunit S n=1 Tax=Pontibacter liquoris TaxID=2905677 RepID=UPI001FA7D9E4|nr:restriction endonuclease subunit S [Pontibacter liquoris]
MIDKSILPAHWEVKKLGDAAKFIDYRGRTPKKTISGIPLITAKNVKMGYINEEPREFIAEEAYESWMTRGIPNEGDVLFTTEAPLGNVARLNTSARIALAQRMITFQAYDFLNSSFLHYNLMSPQFQKALNSKATGTTVKGIKAANLKQLEIFIPPLSEQQEIVARIEELFSELEKGKEQLEIALKQLKVYRQAVLKWAFEGRFTNSVVKDGELPEGWSNSSIGEIFEVFVGSTPSRKIDSYWNGNINWVSSGEVAFCNINETKQKITEEGLTKSSCKLHPPGTVIIAMIGEGKTRGQAAILKVEATHNQNTAAIRVDQDKYLSKLLYYFLVWKYEDNRRVGSGNNQKALNKERVKSIPIQLIPLVEQHHLVQEIESRLSVCDKVEETITKGIQQAETLRQSILKKAFEGKL